MNDLVKYPRLLVIGNCSLSDTTSNGRTLRNFLVDWPKDKLAQFCIRFEYPDYDTCDNYYCVSDREALNAFLMKGKPSGTKHINVDEKPAGDRENAFETDKQIKRNALSMYLRDVIWSSNKWKGDHFEKWVDDFSPELILFQAGDFGYLCKLAVDLSKKRKIPIVVYNSEAYFFKSFDYFGSSRKMSLFYPLFHRRFCKNFKKLMKKAESVIYCCDMLKEDYQKHFDTPAHTVYTATENFYLEDKKKCGGEKLRISYLGNLGVGRHEGLVDIGNALQLISENLHIDVYGKIPNETVRTAFDNSAGVNYCGFVSYEQVKEIMRDSDVLVHIENFSDYYRVDLKYAFSTKIADSLASGKCFLLYAPEEIAASQYLIKNAAAHIVSDKNELFEVLKKIIFDDDFRYKYVSNAMDLVQKNHVSKLNADIFKKILLDAINGD